MDASRLVQLIAPYQQTVVGWKLKSLEEWIHLMPEDKRMTHHKTRCDFMHESCFDRAELCPDVRVLECGNQRCVLIADGAYAIAASLKLVHRRSGYLRGSNYPTDTREIIQETGFISFEGKSLPHYVIGDVIHENLWGLDERIEEVWITDEKESGLSCLMYTHQRKLIPMRAPQYPLFDIPVEEIMPPPVETLHKFKVKARTFVQGVELRAKVRVPDKKKEAQNGALSKKKDLGA